MNETTANFVNETWDNSIIPTLSSYIEIPNMSPNYDPQWATNGKLDEAGQLLFKWAKEREASIKGLSVEWIKLENRTPLIFATIPATCEENKSTILMYGHFDKQPPLAKWSEGLDPYKPVIRNGKLYGRGGADDGYALLAALTSIEALQKQGIPHARIVVIIEGSEESGSIDLPTYVDHLKERIGTPNLIVCLDSGSGNYDQFWVTTNLRGLVVGNLKVHILEAGAHSGRASGIVPSSFRILRQILDRIEDSKTGELPSELYVEIPTARLNEAKSCAKDLGTILHEEFRFVEGSRPVTDNFEELVLNRTWRPTLCVTGVDGLPPLTEAGSVLREYSTVQLSFRIPPTLNPRQTAEFLKEFIEKSPPFGAKVTFDIKKASTGWNAPAMAEWLVEACNANSSFFYKRPAGFLGEGGSIPFMGMLGEKFPEAQFVVTGLLGPESNAHGPDEFLHIQMGKNLTACVVGIIAAHCQNTK